MSPHAPHTAILSCMDARLDAVGFLDEWPNAVHVVRNAGGRVTADVLRSLAASCAMGTERVLVIHHTDCAMAAHSDNDIRDLLPQDTESEIDFLTIDDPLHALERDVQAIRNCALIPAGVEVCGFVYDLDSQAAREIEIQQEGRA